MRNFLIFALLLGVAIAIGGVAGADNEPGTGRASARCEWQGDQGKLHINGTPGQAYQVMNANGRPIAAGVLDRDHTAVRVGNPGADDDGVIYHVQIGDEMLAIDDPNWEWD